MTASGHLYGRHWAVFRGRRHLVWLLYTAITFSSVGWSPISLVFPFVLWGVIGVVAAIAAIGFLTRYARASSTELVEAGRQ